MSQVETGITLSEWNPWNVRSGAIPLPGVEEGYTNLILVGTTGAGKTTLLRQLIGTDPIRERFPSTSAAKTTVSDMEIVMTEEKEYRGVVTFIPLTQAKIYIEECVNHAILASINGRPKGEIVAQLLEHKLQRFRLSYILGSLRGEAVADDDSLDEDAEESEEETKEITEEERNTFQTKLQQYFNTVVQLSKSTQKDIEKQLDVTFANATADERDILTDLLEETLPKNEVFVQLVEDILLDCQSRFEMLTEGTLVYDDNWPSHWYFATESREIFIKTINRFSSNYAPMFGKLLTPLVEGIRVAGPFCPKWAKKQPKLVLIDGEGLGHTPDSALSLSTKTTSRFDLADAILLVDNAAQPLQGSPLMLLRSLVSSGHEHKLIACFTHFDSVKADNLPTITDKKNHVWGSLNNALSNVGEILGKAAENALRRVLDANTVFLAGIDKSINPETKTGKFSKDQLLELLQMLEAKITPPAPVESFPVYNSAFIILSVKQAVDEFHAVWNARLGLSLHPSINKEHWTRIKALTRRMGFMNQDEYGNLRPVGDVIRNLNEPISRFLDKPIRWKPGEPDDDEKQAKIASIKRMLYVEICNIAKRRVLRDLVLSWGNAYNRSGRGSGLARAQDINSVYKAALPIPNEVATSTSSELVREIRQIVCDAILTQGGSLE